MRTNDKRSAVRPLATLLIALLLALGAFTATGGTSTAVEGLSVEVTPPFAENLVGTDHTVMVTITDPGFPVAGRSVDFEVIAGPNVGLLLSDTTDAGGQVSFTYTGSGGGGSDFIGVCALHLSGSGETCAFAVKDWIPLPPPAFVEVTPRSAENVVGSNHTVMVTITDPGFPVAGRSVDFEVIAGPNVGLLLSDTTDAGGQVSFTYTGSGGGGSDFIGVCALHLSGSGETCAFAVKEWVLPPNTPPVASCIESVNPHGAQIPPAGRTTLPGPRGGQNEDGFYQLSSFDAEDGTAPLFVTNASGSATFGPFPSGSVVKFTEDDEAVPTSKPMGGPNSAVTAHIILDSDAFVFAVDSFGEFSPIISCLVPKPPK